MVNVLAKLYSYQKLARSRPQYPQESKRNDYYKIETLEFTSSNLISQNVIAHKSPCPHLAAVLLAHRDVELAESPIPAQQRPAVVNGYDSHLVLVVTGRSSSAYHVRRHADDHVDNTVAVVLVPNEGRQGARYRQGVGARQPFASILTL